MFTATFLADFSCIILHLFSLHKREAVSNTGLSFQAVDTIINIKIIIPSSQIMLK